MEELKLEIEKTVRQIVKNFFIANFDEILIYKKTLSARLLYEQIDKAIDIDVEQYLMSKACNNKIFKEDEQIPENELAEYQAKFEQYEADYESLKKQVIKPIHLNFKSKIEELKKEYRDLEVKYCQYFINKEKPETKPKGVLSIIDKWRKSKKNKTAS